MPTAYPGANDSFGVPSAPSTTPLSGSGSATRNHVQSHQDMGDAIVALQTNAAPIAHDHSGTEARPTNKLAQANTHQSPDTDSGPTALHHTLGTSANQAAAGNHTHDYNGSSILNQPYRICTSTTRPSSPSIGMSIYETDTGCFRMWVAFPPAITASWRLLPHGQVPYMKLTKGTDQSLPTGNTGTFIEWHTEIEDTFGGFNASTSLTNLYVLEPGRYKVEYSICLGTAWFTDTINHGIRVNGAIPSNPGSDPHDRTSFMRGAGLFGAPAGNLQNADNSGEIRCGAGDYVSVWVAHNGFFPQMTGGQSSGNESRILVRYVGL